MSGTQQSQQRDLVFCHECENEWYRDEHGLTCPQCQSDFTEIIEEEHDPRAELLADMMADDNDHDHDHQHPPPLHGLHNHNPWANAADPEEQDINNFHFTRNGPGSFTFHGTFYRTIPPRTAGEHNTAAPPGAPAAPLVQNFTTMLQNILGGAAGNARGPPDPTAHLPAGSPLGSPGGTPQPGPFGPNHGRFTYNATARVSPRDANHPQPHVEPLDDINSILNQTLFAGMGGPPPGGHPPGQPQNPHGAPPPGFNPIAALLASILQGGPIGPQGAHGDFVFSQEALDRIISQLMEQNATGNAPGPASAEAIAALPRTKLTTEMLRGDAKGECSICMDDVKVGEEVTELPCKHWFHDQCVTVWLKEHDTCPHCRKGIMEGMKQPTQGQGEAHPAAGEASSSSEDSSRRTSMPGAWSNADQAAAASAASPRSTPRRPSDHGGGGLGERLRRNLFGGGRS